MGIIENTKEIVNLVQKIDNIELYRKILDLQSEVLELTAQLAKKDEMINRLHNALELRGKLICKDSAYYLIDESGKTDGPFCTKCFDVDKIKCRLVADNKEPQIICPNCKVSFSSKPVYNFLRPDVEERRKQSLEMTRRHNDSIERSG